MARRVFFSFEYEHDISRAMVVRNSWVTQGREAAGFIDAAAFEEVKKGGDAAHRNVCGRKPEGYPFYLWNRDDGYRNMGDWIEKAAKDAGR